MRFLETPLQALRRLIFGGYNGFVSFIERVSVDLVVEEAEAKHRGAASNGGPMIKRSAVPENSVSKFKTRIAVCFTP